MTWIDADPFIDIPRLKEIEQDIIKGICLSNHVSSSFSFRLNEQRPDFYTSLDTILSKDETLKSIYEAVRHDNHAQTLFFKLFLGAYCSGTTVNIRKPERYADRHKAALCHDTENVVHFETLMDFIKTLPFAEFGRVIVFVTDHDLCTPIHRDGTAKPQSHRNEFLWMSPNKDKKFFLYDPKSDTKSFITSHSTFFNEQAWHGTEPSSNMCFSIRIDGVFTDEFREALGIAQLTDYRSI